MMEGLSDVRLTLVQSIEDVQDFLRWLSETRPVLGLDIETSGLQVARDDIRLVQFGDAHRGWALPYRDWRGVVHHVLSSYEGKFVLHHAKFDAGFLRRDGLPFPWERVHDTMMMCFLHDSTGPKSLKQAAAQYIDPMARAGEAKLKLAMRKNDWDHGDIPIELPAYWGYAALDSVLTARLAEKLWPQVQYAREAYEVELGCQHVLSAMELRGLSIDIDYVEDARGQQLAELNRVRDLLGGLNAHNNSDVARALQEEGAVLTKRTQTGAFSVDEEVLSAASDAGFKVAQLVLQDRTLSKLVETYLDNFLKFHESGIINPHIKQLAARTGRMSVTQPSLQNLPRSALVRDAFIPREGNQFLLVDYAAQELRVAAHVGQDERMLAAFNEGRDLHSETALALYGPGFTKAQRTTAKNAVFSLCYGAGTHKFAVAAGISEAEAQLAFTKLRQLYPGLARAMGQVTNVVRQRATGNDSGYIVTINDGRRLRVRGDKAYQGLNTLIQGSCAAVLKRALVDLDAAGLGDYLALPIHDEVMFDVPREEVENARKVAMETMRRDDFSAPLEVESQVVEKWGDPYR